MSGPFGGPAGGPPPGAPGQPPYYRQPYWAPSQPSPSRMGSGRIVVVFVGALLALALVAGVLIFLNQPPPPVAPCPPGQPCAPVPSLPPVASSPLPITTTRPQGSPVPLPTPAAPATPALHASPGATFAPVETPTSNSPVALSGTLYTDQSLGYGFEYDPETFTLDGQTDGSAVLDGVFFDAQIWVDAKTADTSPAKMIESELADVDRLLIARVPDTDTYDALLGPSIGYVPGQGNVWSGTLVSRDGTPVAPGGVTIVSATDGRITVAVVVVVSNPDARQADETQEHAVRHAADELLKTFKWSVP